MSSPFSTGIWEYTEIRFSIAWKLQEHREFHQHKTKIVKYKWPHNHNVLYSKTFNCKHWEKEQVKIKNRIPNGIIIHC